MIIWTIKNTAEHEVDEAK